MKITTVYHIPVFLITLAVASCSPPAKENPAPSAQTMTSNFTYSGYDTPEPVVDVAAQYTGRNSTGETGNNLIVLGQTQVAGGYKMYYFYQSKCLCGGSNTLAPYNVGGWSTVIGPRGGGAVKIAISGNTAYVVTAQNELWTAPISGTFTNPTWTQLPFSAVDVAAYNSYVYFLGADNISSNHPIYRLSNGVATEVVPGASAVSLAVDELGRSWVVRSDNRIWRGSAPGTSGNYEAITGTAVDIASTGESVAVLYSVNNEPYARDVMAPPSSGWAGLTGQATQVSASAGIYGSFFVVTSAGQLYKLYTDR